MCRAPKGREQGNGELAGSPALPYSSSARLPGSFCLFLRNFSASTREGLPLQCAWGSQQGKVSRIQPCPPLWPPARSLQRASTPGALFGEKLLQLGEINHLFCILRVTRERPPPHLQKEVLARGPSSGQEVAKSRHQIPASSYRPVAVKLVLSSRCPALRSQAFPRRPSSLFRRPEGNRGGGGSGKDIGSFSPRHIWGGECLNDLLHSNQPSSA